MFNIFDHKVLDKGPFKIPCKCQHEKRRGNTYNSLDSKTDTENTLGANTLYFLTINDGKTCDLKCQLNILLGIFVIFLEK